MASPVASSLRSNFIGLSYIDYVNCHAGFFHDTEVEVHFRPTYMYNPYRNWKLQRWVFANLEKDDKSGENVEFYYPSVRFNLVFSLIHIYRHVFEEGIGLRQLTDYYYILNHSTEQERSEAYMTLKSFGLKSFSEALMYVMNQVYGIAEEHLPSKLGEKEGLYLLEEIMRGGNFGKYDDRNKFLPNERRIARGMLNAKRNLRFLKRYPNEVIWMPVWKIWHWGWREFKGYL